MFNHRTTSLLTTGNRRLRIGLLSITLALLAACSSSGTDNAGPADDSPPSQGGGQDTGQDTGATDNDTAGQDNDDSGNGGDNPDDGGNGGTTGTETGSDTGADNGNDNNIGNGTTDSGDGNPVSSDITAGRVLGPLPNPPLTAAPGADSEPVRATGPITNVSEFFVVRNPTRDLDDDFGVLTDADFAAGPLPAVHHIPDHVDISTNALPYFDNLTDVEVFAGDELTVVFRPLDDDGGIPGLFPNAIPAGARYVDNFNGTRSLIWRPLQPQVGIQEFTITATDPVEPYYRTERTIRIKVKMPSDPSGIINLPPVVNEIWPRTVRVNDFVTLYIKVSDPNGTIPSLEIANPPAGATIVPHYSDEDISILRFTPRNAETIELQLTARDAEDSSLSTSRTVTLEVLEDSDFIRPGTRLRELAASRDLLIGYAALQGFYEQPDGALYADIAAEEFNFVTTENSLKWDLVNPLPGKYRWAQADNLVQHAKTRRQTVHGHTLVWHRQLPGWIQRSPLSEREGHMREFIDRVITRYGSDIPVWDVVNEALEEDGSFRQSTWYEAMGADFIDIAFRQARLSAPEATLLYNEYDVSFAGPKSDGLIALMTALTDAGTPVDGVGFQMHLDADFDRYDEVAATFNTIAALDLDIYITELDVSIRSGMTEEQQAQVYEEVLSLCLDQPRCKAYQAWGFTDMYSWRREFSPLLLDKRYQPKPAYFAIQERLGLN
ncbi:endo-1,4-beta-xylanase [Granulosicoccus sp. 3-233]|uniref:endo-1,4-beta-xylanase n=1 Tax=Granulosicoccus sp. 3-233 TaxID=3417969 RepID=UPI003D3464E6